RSAWRELGASGRLPQFILLCLGVWLHAADTLVTATIMPPVVEDIGGVAYVNWTISLYQIGSILAGAATGALSRRLGLRRMLIGAAAVYGLGCIANALTPDMAIMLAARLVQGFGGGAMLTVSYVAIQLLFPERLWTRLMAIVAMIWGVAALCGPLIGGLFAHAGIWRGLFWTFAAQAALLAAAALTLLGENARDAPPPGRWPWWPLTLLAAATLLIAEAGAVARPALSVPLGAAGLGLLYGAARCDGRMGNRLLPAQLLDIGSALGAGLLMVFALSAATTAFWAYGPLILQVAFAVDPLVSGYLMAAEALAWSLCTVMTAGVRESRDWLVIRLGVAVIAVSGVGFIIVMPAGALPGILVCMLLQGAGFGLCWPFIVRRTVILAPAHERGLAASAAPTVQRIGYAVGAAAAGIAANAAGLGDGITVETARAAAFWVFAAFLPLFAIGAAAALRFTARPP
ncbi:MAG TPA: MFS transporter, partial [Stellaceae bacterium]|nr:MFS transporter [Stellaceae bacterium]